jgi:outer membrane protein assembly factor BamA
VPWWNKPVLLLLCFLAVSGVNAQTVLSNEITAISIVGLKRTKPHVAERYVEKFLGRDAASLDLKEVEGAVLDTGILEPLVISIDDDPEGGGRLLQIELREKWSILPFPIFFAGSGGIGGGAFFMDANAFGLNDKMILGGMYRRTGWMVMAMYINTPDRERVPGWSLRGSYAQEDRTDSDQNDKDIRRFSQESITAATGISYPLNDFFVPSLSLTYDGRLLRHSDDPLRVPGGDAHIISLSPELSLQRAVWDGYLSAQQSASLAYIYTIGIDYPSSHALSFRGVYERSLIPGFKLGLKTGVFYAPDVEALFEASPSAAQVNILPRNYTARNYAGGSFDIEKYLYKFSFGTLSLLASYQGVWSQGPILGQRFDHGVAGSLRFYLSKLAFPALGVGAAYNVEAKYFQIGLDVGMSF